MKYCRKTVKNIFYDQKNSKKGLKKNFFLKRKNLEKMQKNIFWM